MCTHICMYTTLNIMFIQINNADSEIPFSVFKIYLNSFHFIKIVFPTFNIWRPVLISYLKAQRDENNKKKQRRKKKTNFTICI